MYKCATPRSTGAKAVSIANSKNHQSSVNTTIQGYAEPPSSQQKQRLKEKMTIYAAFPGQLLLHRCPRKQNVPAPHSSDQQAANRVSDAEPISSKEDLIYFQIHLSQKWNLQPTPNQPISSS